MGWILTATILNYGISLVNYLVNGEYPTHWLILDAAIAAAVAFFIIVKKSGSREHI